MATKDDRRLVCGVESGGNKMTKMEFMTIAAQYALLAVVLFSGGFFTGWTLMAAAKKAAKRVGRKPWLIL